MYKESKEPVTGNTEIEITCDARCGEGVCGNCASVSMPDRKAAQHMLFVLGWRLLRGHHVCSSCMKKKRISFPRKAKQ